MPPKIEVQLQINDFSDGDPSHTPGMGTYYLDLDTYTYREKLGKIWADKRGLTKPGHRYVLDRLPAGYSLWARRRINKPEHIDRWLYGHPLHHSFDSPNRFSEHFINLMEHGDAEDCACSSCLKGKTARQDRSQGKRGKFGNSAGKLREDSDGNIDALEYLIEKLKKQGTIDEDINELMNMNWRTEKRVIVPYLRKLQQQPAWIPRQGEIVLYVRDMKDTEIIASRESDGAHFVVDTADMADDKDMANAKFRKPKWEAGIIAQAPMEGIVFEDLVHRNEKDSDVNISGFRIEPLPDPNSDDKQPTLQHKYIPLCQIRPMALFHEFLKGVEADEQDDTISNAIMCGAVMSLLVRDRFIGKWPSANMFCQGFFLGFDNIILGDCVYYTSDTDASQEQVDILQIDQIKVYFTNLDKADDDMDEEADQEKLVFRVVGTAYTPDKRRSSNRAPVPVHELPDCLQGYAPLWMVHAADETWEICFWRVLGRVYPREAIDAWLAHLGPDADNETLLDLTREGVLDARRYSAAQYTRLPEKGGWFWGDSRQETLDIHTIQGESLGPHDLDRDPKRDRAQLLVLDGQDEGKKNAVHNKKVLRFLADKHPNSSGMVMGALRLAEEDAEGATGNEDDNGGISDDEEDDTGDNDASEAGGSGVETVSRHFQAINMRQPSIASSAGEKRARGEAAAGPSTKKARG